MRDQEIIGLWEAYQQVCEAETARGPRLIDAYDKPPYSDDAAVAKNPVKMKRKGPKMKGVVRREEVEIAAQYFYEMGLNEDGVNILIEELGVEEFGEFVYEIVEEHTLTEARAGGVRIEPVTVKGQKFKSGKPTGKSLERLRAQKAARQESEAKSSSSKPSGMKASLQRQSAVAAAAKKQPKKPGLLDRVAGAVNKGIERHNRAMSDLNKMKKATAVTAGKVKKAAGEFKRGFTEEVEAWVNALVEDGYDLSEYTWDDMCEMYMSETRRDPRGRPASGPMSVYGGRGTPSPDPEGDDNVSRMDRAQRRVKRTQPRAKGMAADALFTKYSARQRGMGHGGEEGPGPKAPSRGGRSGRGANTDRGSGNAAKRRMSEDFDLFDVILEYLVAEGYADTNKAALAIMANMSEEWKQSIVEGTAAIRANVPQPGQRTVSMTATGKEPAGDRLIRQAGQAISSFLGSRGVVKSEPALQRKPLVSRAVK